MLLWLLSCLLPSDSVLHQQALRGGSQADCSGIHAPDLAGDCWSWKASLLAADGEVDQAAQICSAMEDSQWKGECWFLVADATEAQRADATTLCQHAAPYERECVDHAVQRLAEALLASHGAEMEAIAELTDRWTPLYGQKEASQRSRALVSALIGQRPHPLSRATFGDADDALVQMTLTQHLSKRSCRVLGLDVASLQEEIDEALLAARATKQCSDSVGH